MGNNSIVNFHFTKHTKKMNKKKNKKNKVKKNKKWVIKIIIWTTILSSSISFFSNMALPNVNLISAFIILAIIILIGILFDIIGVSVTAASEVPFHSMASKKIKGSKIAVKLIRNADKVSNFCNDVIGDVCGVISGVMGTLVLSKTGILVENSNKYGLILTSFIGAIIAATTVGGKAIGKSFAIKNSNKIVYAISKIIYAIKKER